jgi:hypothetical protein
VIRRWLAILLIPALLVVAGIVDHPDRGQRTAKPVSTATTVRASSSSLAALGLPSAGEADGLGPVVAPPDALDATWFCAGGSSNPGGVADASVAIANGGDHAGPATLTVYTGDGHSAATTVQVAAHSEKTVALSTVVKAETVAATVDVTGGEVAVSQTVAGPDGSASHPCATAPSASWYFANGSTVRGADEKLYLFNPFDDDAAANVTLQTDAGLRQPPALQGLIVKARSLQVVDLASVENRRKQIAATVKVTSGRLVAARQQRFDGSGEDGPAGVPPRGIEASPGARRATGAVAFPFAYKTTGYGEVLFVYNPGSAAANVSVSIILDDPAQNGTMPDQPLQLAPGATASLDLTNLQPLPPRVLHSIVVHSSGSPVVAELWQQRSDAIGGGLAITTGSPVLATTWALPGLTVAQSSTFVDVVNPGGSPATLHASVLVGGASTPVQGLDGVTVPARGRLRVRLTEKALGGASVALWTTSSSPVAVGWDRTTSNGAFGINLSVGIPLSGTTSLP